MKRDELFEVLEPPPHGLTRLRARLAARRARRLLWPALVSSLAALLVVLFVPREQPVDLRAALADSVFGAEGPPVSALDGSALAVERLPSSNPQVVLYRVASLTSDAAFAPSPR